MRKIISILILVHMAASVECKQNEHPSNRYFDGTHLRAAEFIDAGDESSFKTTLKALADVDTPGRETVTLLWYAIAQKNFNAIRDLIKAGSQPDKQLTQGLGSALHFSLISSDTRFLQAMLDGGLSPDFRTPGGSSLLQRSMIGGEAAFAHVRLLVEHGANVNLRDSINGSALDEALFSHHPDIAIYLVEHGADVNGHLVSGTSTAWIVQGLIESFAPSAKQATVTAYSTDADGKLTASMETPPPPGLSLAGQKLLKQFKQLRTLMIEKGAKFPADPPEKVRAQIERAGNPTTGDH